MVENVGHRALGAGNYKALMADTEAAIAAAYICLLSFSYLLSVVFSSNTVLLLLVVSIIIDFQHTKLVRSWMPAPAQWPPRSALEAEYDLAVAENKRKAVRIGDVEDDDAGDDVHLQTGFQNRVHKVAAARALLSAKSRTTSEALASRPDAQPEPEPTEWEGWDEGWGDGWGEQWNDEEEEEWDEDWEGEDGGVITIFEGTEEQTSFTNTPHAETKTEWSHLMLPQTSPLRKKVQGHVVHAPAFSANIFALHDMERRMQQQGNQICSDTLHDSEERLIRDAEEAGRAGVKAGSFEARVAALERKEAKEKADRHLAHELKRQQVHAVEVARAKVEMDAAMTRFLQHEAALAAKEAEAKKVAEAKAAAEAKAKEAADVKAKLDNDAKVKKDAETEAKKAAETKAAADAQATVAANLAAADAKSQQEAAAKKEEKLRLDFGAAADAKKAEFMLLRSEYETFLDKDKKFLFPEVKQGRIGE
jgi:hypothetical protein